LKSTPPPKPRPAVRRRAGAPNLACGGQTFALDAGEYSDLNGARRLAALALVCAAAALALQPAIVAVAGAEGVLKWSPAIANLAMYVFAGRLLLTVPLAGMVLRTREDLCECANEPA
jgi:hypothetical protein